MATKTKKGPRVRGAKGATPNPEPRTLKTPPAAGGLVIERVKLAALKAAAYNPRADLQPGDPEYEKIARSLDAFGYVDPLVWNRRGGNLVAGHQRLKILAARGVTEVDVSVVELDATDERRLNLALNRAHGQWDEQRLSDVVLELRAKQADLAATGFDSDELDLLAQRDELGAAAPQTQVADSFKVVVTCRDARQQNEVRRWLAKKGVACHTLTRGRA